LCICGAAACMSRSSLQTADSTYSAGTAQYPGEAGKTESRRCTCLIRSLKSKQQLCFISSTKVRHTLLVAIFSVFFLNSIQCLTHQLLCVTNSLAFYCVNYCYFLFHRPRLLFHTHSRSDLLPKGDLWGLLVQVSKGQISFLYPIQQHT